MNAKNTLKKTMSLLLVFALFLVMIPVPAMAAESDNCDHVYFPLVTAPTCTRGGYTTYICENDGCSSYYVADRVDPLPHNYETETVDATCTEDGYIANTCTGCGNSTMETLPATGHDYATAVIAPTCEADGYTAHYCNNCGDYYTTDPVDALGHNYTTQVITATCSTAGYTVHTCANCSHAYTTDTVNPTGHTYTSKTVSGKTVYTCTSCGHTYTKTAAKTTYSRVTKFTANKTYVVAVYNGTTAYALSHSGNNISAVKITISGGKITSAVDEDLLWNYAAGKLSYDDNGTTRYLYSAPTNSSGSATGYITLSTNDSTYSFISYASNKLKVGSQYLRFNNGTIKGYRTGGTTYLMQKSN